MKTRFFIILALIAAAAGPSCNRAPQLPVLSHADTLAIIDDNVAFRAEQDSFFRSDPHSPFVRDTSARYHGIKWFPVDPQFRVQSVLHLFADADTVDVMGTRGERRRQLRYGYFEFPVPLRGGVSLLRLNVYKFTPYDGDRYARYPENLCVWFTDSTTGGETYEVGRYVDVGNDLHDPGHLYTIDLNKAYNPYCAYSAMYSCAIPRKEDQLPMKLRVGEMKYHE